MKKYLPVEFFFAIFLMACGQISPTAAPQYTPLASLVPQETDAIPLPTAAPQVLPSDVPDILPTPASEGVPAPALAARDDLAARLNVGFEQVEISAITPKDWPDSCLGIIDPGLSCAAVVTPGYEIVLSVGTAQYRYHTDSYGRSTRLFSGPKLSTGGEQNRTILEWTSFDPQGPSGCSAFSVSTQAAFWGLCGQAQQVVPGIDPTQEPLKHWIESFAPFEMDTPSGKIKYYGLGDRSPSDKSGVIVASGAEQRSMAEWAKLQFEVAQAGRAGAAWGLAFSYSRQGGIAGFCDDVAVYLDGRAQITNCKGLNVTMYLSASELNQLYGWFDAFKTVDYSHTDPATADAITIFLAMPGQGQKAADDAAIRAIVEFAAGLTNQAGFSTQVGPELSAAQQALEDYFKALHSGDFILGAKLYGGPTDGIQTWNPDIKDNLPALLERACKQNGLVCLLPRSIRYHGPDSRTGYQFLVEFNNPDGSLFTQGPCCGDDSGVPGITRFVFAVVPLNDNWQVMDLPPYVP